MRSFAGVSAVRSVPTMPARPVSQHLVRQNGLAPLAGASLMIDLPISAFYSINCTTARTLEVTQRHGVG
jgi:hypothetical protein